ncbi:hypothetical protein A7K50_07695 [Dehalobacter sp. MCB1]|nr:hypothetical protein A7K50_07695 [Dehalobacter sp. MCB1]TCX51728.1 hypothetical protein C1I36_05205 [Dehalobacter sp. 14DCB1]TCX52788.1 hypothetical protein C1I38_06885 [Dehalobacter sp. 12DCB1]
MKTDGKSSDNKEIILDPYLFLKKLKGRMVIFNIENVHLTVVFLFLFVHFQDCTKVTRTFSQPYLYQNIFLSFLHKLALSADLPVP